MSDINIIEVMAKHASVIGFYKNLKTIFFPMFVQNSIIVIPYFESCFTCTVSLLLYTRFGLVLL